MKIHLEEIVRFLEELIAIPSLSGEESQVLQVMEQELSRLGCAVERMDVAPGRFNLLVRTGTPRVLLTTHLDVVPGPEQLFSPRRVGDSIYGRGACDAKGIAVCMLAAYRQLLASGITDVGLLFVVGEEEDGIGARVAAQTLCDSGIEFLINGEPTEGKLASAHKGVLDAEIRFSGKACHSGYPELGVDANRKMLLCANRLLGADFGTSAVLGDASVNIGVVRGGSSANTVSDNAMLRCCIRTVGTDNAKEKALLETLCQPEQVTIIFDAPPVVLNTIEGFETAVMSYGSDIPNFSDLNCQMLMYGPGSILRAHTDDEYITLPELEHAVHGYQTIVRHLLRAR